MDHTIINGMTETVKMDRAGRVVIPRRIRDAFGVADGAFDLEIEASEDGITLRPAPDVIPATRHRTGWVVFDSGEPDSVDPVAAVADERARRQRTVTGKR
jgi:AbrB family looped-hinge helix DNA binding protein